MRTRRAATGPFVSPAPAVHPPGASAPPPHSPSRPGRQALDSANSRPEEIGFLVALHDHPGSGDAGTSSAVAGALGITGGAVDLNAACAGFTYGLITAAGMLADRCTEGAAHRGRDDDPDPELGRPHQRLPLRGRGRSAGPRSGQWPRLAPRLGCRRGRLPGQPALRRPRGQGMVMRGQEVFRRAVRATADSANAALKLAKVERRRTSPCSSRTRPTNGLWKRSPIGSGSRTTGSRR